MKINIYRGTHEIGGTCIELTAENGKTLWIDLGLPLSKVNPDIDYASKNKPDALLISHSHQDHFGLMESVGRNTEIFIGQVTLDLINASRIFLNKNLAIGTFQIIKPWQFITIANTFKIKPFLVDHSSPEAFAFLIEADNKRIFYSGDFRATGNKRKLFETFVLSPPDSIDLLLIEGTMVERSNHSFLTEMDVEKAIYDIISNQTNVSFVVSSAQNVDRFVSVFKACRKSGKTVVVDIYNSWVLEMVKKNSPNLPSIDWDNISVYNHPNQLEIIQSAEFADFRKRVELKSVGNNVFTNPAQYVYFLRCPSMKLIDALRPNGKMTLIYSQWEGYLHDEHKTYFTDTINSLKNDAGIQFHSIHTSGHATLPELKELARTLKPQKTVPIHTEYPEKFKHEFNEDGLSKVDVWEDGKEYRL
jgi:Predicted hydrolase of the metallo-beta-lactamase superfamily